MSIVLQGSTSGSITLQEPAVAGSNTLSLPAVTATLATEVNGALYPLNSGTAVASTSGTSIDFTSIPSWVKRITVMFNGVSLSGTASFLIQNGSGSVTTTGYVSTSNYAQASVGVGGASSTSGHLVYAGAASSALSGHLVLTNITGNTWVSSHTFLGSTAAVVMGGGTIALGGTLDRVRITTTNGTDTFDAGTINILYE